ncbi:MAG: NAD(P)-dependent oxidoreductase [Firmicutes bacterium]|nr:NAD(P)-dependent oxidoreductase [Bacillota bacterium]
MTIGFIGLGIMGESMSENIIKKHDDTVYVYDVVKEKTDKMAALGGVGCESALDLAQKSDVIVTMVPKSQHLAAVYEEILPVMKGKIGIDMSTIDPAVSMETAKKVKAAGGRFADCPVVKSKPAAINATLGILVGCDEDLYETIRPILLYMGCNVKRMGENGSGITMKICHNCLVAQIQNGVNETLSLAGKFGIAPKDFAEAVSYGGAQNFYLDSQWQNLEADNWTTAFSLANEHKDLGICLSLAEQVGLPMPGAANAKAVYDYGMAHDMGAMDFRTTYKIVRERKN